MELIYDNASSPEEKFRSSWTLWETFDQASMAAPARLWLDKAAQVFPAPVVHLELAWDQTFRLKDSILGRSLWGLTNGPWLDTSDARKARLLRQRLFLGTKSLVESGGDDYVSTVILDRDDLWVGTWNGALIRWSLTAKTAELIRQPDSTVTPIKSLTATAWFVYAFQDQNFLRYSKVTGSWRSFPYPPGWTGLRIQGVVADSEESLWVAYLGQGLWRWERGQWTLIDDQGAGPFLNALASDGQGGFWVGTKDRGLWSWKDGIWSPVSAEGQAGPFNISVIEPRQDYQAWAVGTWGEGAWRLEQNRLVPVSRGSEYVTAAAWSGLELVWGFLDEGIAAEISGEKITLGPLDGLPSGGVSALVVWEGRWIWGNNGQGLGWWSEYENPEIHR